MSIEPGTAEQRKERTLANKAVGAAALLLAVVVMGWPALFNGAAFFFPDTPTYLRGAGTAVYELTGWENDWSDRHRLLQTDSANSPTAPANDRGDGGPMANSEEQLAHPVLLGRSIYYGLSILPFMLVFGSLGGVFIQAALAVLVLWIMLRAIGLGEGRRLTMRVLIAALALSLFTSLPFFVSLLMPDVFTGFTAALAFSAIVGWARLNIFEKTALVSVSCLAAMAHSSNILILVAILVLGIPLRFWFREIRPVAMLFLAIAAVTGIFSERVFSEAVAAQLGQPPIRPPFLTARLISEGPALTLLRENCPEIGFEACRFQNRMPQDSDTFLWSVDPSEGVFSVESHAVQRRLAEQDSKIALATLRAYPIEVISHSLRASARQLFMAQADIFNLPASEVGQLPPRFEKEVLLSRSATGRMPMAFLNISIYSTTLIAAFVLLGVGMRGRHREHRAAVLLLFGVVFANALVAGALSKPHNRYNARLLWVLPLAAGAIVASWRNNSRARCSNEEG